MNAISTLFTEVYLLKPEVHFDKRGSFKEYFVYQNFEKLVGRKITFCQDFCLSFRSNLCINL